MEERSRLRGTSRLRPSAASAARHCDQLLTRVAVATARLGRAAYNNSKFRVPNPLLRQP
jgi:hypothetical protein